MYWHWKFGGKIKCSLHLAKSSYHILHHRAHTVPERCFLAHCSLFMPFIHCRQSCVIYGVSKEYKHHSTYLSECHCYEPEHFATFSPSFHFNSTFTHKSASHIFYCLNWRSPLCWRTNKFVCIFPIINLDFGVWWRIQWGSHLSLLSRKSPHIRNVRGHNVTYLVEALHFKPKIREFESHFSYWEFWLIFFFPAALWSWG